LLIAAAALLVVRSLIGLPYLSDVTDAARAAYANSTDPNLTGDPLATIIRASTIGSAVVAIILAAGYAIFAVLDLRGSNVGRILTWIFAGIGVLCCGVGSAIGGASSSLTSGSKSSNGIDTKAATDQINNAYPSWYVPTSVVITVLFSLLLLAVIILLLLPAANPYFKRGRAAQVTPPGQEPPYPTMPG